jgi:dTMP kinase
MTRRGLFLTFEGMDGCGKTTQMRLLIDRLRAEGHEVIESAEPGGTRIGKQVRRILLDSANQELGPTAEMLLYFACRAQNVDELITPGLAGGAVIVSDRFTDSTLVYQGVGRRLGEDVVRTLHEIACRGVQPELTIYLEIDLETSLARAHARNRELEDMQAPDERRMDEQAREFHARVREAYTKLAEREPERIRKIDGRRSIEEVAAAVWEAVKERLDV